MARRRSIEFMVMSPVVNASERDRKSTRLNSSHLVISYAVFCLKKKKVTPDDRAIDVVCVADELTVRETDHYLSYRQLLKPCSRAMCDDPSVSDLYRR